MMICCVVVLVRRCCCGYGSIGGPFDIATVKPSDRHLFAELNENAERVEVPFDAKLLFCTCGMADAPLDARFVEMSSDISFHAAALSNIFWATLVVISLVLCVAKDKDKYFDADLL